MELKWSETWGITTIQSDILCQNIYIISFKINEEKVKDAGYGMCNVIR